MEKNSRQRVRYLVPGDRVRVAWVEISDKMVRNHLSNVFDKLGVWTRAQAIVFARDRGFATSRPERRE